MTSLTDRYVAATLRAVPAPRREEIAAELRGSIEDMIDGRSATGEDTTTAEREVLTELGDPAQLAARYADRRLQLIGPTYYLAWLRLLKLLLSFVPAVVGVVVGLVEAADGDKAGGAIGAGIGAAIQVTVQIGFWVTLVFAIIERTNTKLDLPAWTVDQLPNDRPDQQISFTDAAAAVGSLVLAIAYLPVQHFWSFVPDRDGGSVPIFDPALWTFWLPLLMVVLVASVGLEIAKYRTGRWTRPLVTTNAVLDLAFAIPAIWLLQTDRLLSPELVGRFDWLSQADNLNTVANISTVTIVVITLWDIVDSILKSRRAAA